MSYFCEHCEQTFEDHLEYLTHTHIVAEYGENRVIVHDEKVDFDKKEPRHE